MTKQSWSRRTENLLWAAGLGCASLCLVTATRAHHASVAAAHIVPEQSNAARLVRTAAGVVPTAGSATVIGRLEVPRLHLSVPILSDYEPDSLLKGVGHIHGTAFPGGLGTVGLAGHRDTFLRPLRGIAPGMEIRLVDRSGTYLYQVDRTEIVTPDQVEVLDIVTRPELAVVTCYPFFFVGSAPKRFVVHAHLLSLLPQEAMLRSRQD